MRVEQIAEFVAAALGAGAEIVALDESHYVIGDADLLEAQGREVHRILAEFGDRDHLRVEICSYLIGLGRVYPWVLN